MSDGKNVVGSDLPERSPAGICQSRHPLLEDLQCQRLMGHPGRHGAAVESTSTELAMEWTDEAPRDAIEIA